jgi:hypothetical protein
LPAVNDQGREFFVTEDSPDPEPGSPMTEYWASTLESAGDAAEILRREASEYADLAPKDGGLAGPGGLADDKAVGASEL